ncbi:hypothetical protein [Shewanella algae]|uniref:hypothetical protein n=1 Tax=Shewanella algae TaxID=38313 RepID=UPI00399BEB0C
MIKPHSILEAAFAHRCESWNVSETTKLFNQLITALGLTLGQLEELKKEHQ